VPARAHRYRDQGAGAGEDRQGCAREGDDGGRGRRAGERAVGEGGGQLAGRVGAVGGAARANVEERRSAAGAREGGQLAGALGGQTGRQGRAPSTDTYGDDTWTQTPGVTSWPARALTGT
jgi:hypothetical protein